MDNNKINQLREKRLQLQEEIRLKSLRDRIANQLDYLDKQNFHYTIYYEAEHLHWINKNIPFKSNKEGLSNFQIETDTTDEAANCVNCASEEDLINELKTTFLSLFDANDKVIICYDGGDTEIEISVATFLKKPLLFFANPETWLLLNNKSYVLEYFWDEAIIRLIKIEKLKPITSKKMVLSY